MRIDRLARTAFIVISGAGVLSCNAGARDYPREPPRLVREGGQGGRNPRGVNGTYCGRVK